MDRVLATRLTRMERRLAAMELALDQAHIARPTPRSRPEAPTPPVQFPPPEPASASILPPPLPPSAVPHAARTRESKPPTPRPRSTPSPRPEPRTHTPASPPDWERFFGLAVLGRICVAAVLLAAGYFAQLAYKGLPPFGKVACKSTEVMIHGPVQHLPQAQIGPHRAKPTRPRCSSLAAHCWPFSRASFSRSSTPKHPSVPSPTEV